ncbi:hypothetical protein G6011_06060 [Alternaria panax]|uniref:Uncharacterized protein n=1 Tax=Alternaria panax TaxID=48097 RepID=A0AAD4I7V1_9PLEO|nr:hypothetical protein G6011_06060 [Alternaria panax]
MPSLKEAKMEREPPAGTNILVVEGGIGALTFAIKAYRKGHDVRVLERNNEGQYSYGSALETPNKWPGLMDRARAVASPPDFDLRKSDDTFIQRHAPGDSDNPSLGMYRKRLHNLLNMYVKELGIPITCETKVGTYFETNHTGGVILDTGKRITADVVIAADGVGSKSREMLDDNREKPISSGFVVYRASFPAGSAIEKSPLVAKEFVEYNTRSIMYIGPGAHIVFGIDQSDFCHLLTCKDENSEVTENWSKTTSTDKILDVVEDWDRLVTELIKTTPDSQCLDWKLMWRDPQPQWHIYFCPSFSGGTMAMEDACSLGAL